LHQSIHLVYVSVYNYVKFVLSILWCEALCLNFLSLPLQSISYLTGWNKVTQHTTNQQTNNLCYSHVTNGINNNNICYLGGIGTGPGVIHVDNFSKSGQQGGRQRSGPMNSGYYENLLISEDVF